MRNFLAGFVVLMCIGCSSIEPALSVSDSPMMESYPVKGRNGWQLNQKLEFGEYQTTKVKRSWTRTRETITDLEGRRLSRSYPDLITHNYSDKDQSFYFQINDQYGNTSDVYGTSEFHSHDLQLGDNRNSMGNILQDIIGGDFSENIFYLQVFVNDEERPWQLILDNDASQVFAGEYEGILGFDMDHYYLLHPITKMQGKSGPRTIAGSLGFEVFTKDKKPVAAVYLENNGKVYFHTRDPKERFLMANLAAALLLQQDIAM